MVSDIPAGDGKTANLFFTVYVSLAAATPILSQPANTGRMLPYFKLIYSLFFLYAVTASRVLEWSIFRKGDIKGTVPRDF